MRWIMGRRARAQVLGMSDKGPWGGGGSEGSSGGGAGGGDDGPRNPWSMPPGGRRGKPGGGSTSLEDFLKRARSGGPGGGGPQLPANVGRLWGAAVAVLVVIWIAFTSIHSIEPQERGVVTMFGSYSRTLNPGIQLTLPAPIARVQVEDVQNTRTEVFPAGGSQPNLMLTGDQNIADLAYSVRWNIKSPEDYVFEIKNPQETVRAVAESAMRAAVAGVNLTTAIGSGRGEIEAEVQTRMQGLLDEYQSGVRVLGVSIQKAAAPAEVDDAFKAVTAAQQEAQSNLNRSRAYAQQVIARAQGDATEFDKIYEQYRMAPDVTRRRLYYETMEQVLTRADKTIVQPGTQTYLPLPEVRRQQATPEAEAPAAATPTAPTAQPTGAAR
ncbi:protease modulator HflK [Sphingomonas sp. Leaf25]|uniref:protease modulator HflK n=1 Tax=Sphingomonas sp. Leaf25 TaxID=1735692 RepID=UPI0006FF6959|nr:protease modulator HflK [Sphingomonas sp. Leaf25]KQN07637.1 peptidase [Sphingomonas sp. Leaf25]